MRMTGLRMLGLAASLSLVGASAVETTVFTGLGDRPGGAFDSFATAVSADGSVVVGASQSGAGEEAFRWTAAKGMIGLGDFRGGPFSSRAYDASADGSVVVGVGTSASGREAFRWTAATGMVGLGDLPGGDFGSMATDISADGSVVVGVGMSGANVEPFLWDASGGMRRLHDFLVAHDVKLTGWRLEDASGISADGLTFVGWGLNPAGKHEAWLARIDGNVPPRR
jgi:probable HAF family extracellular repeat protein